MSSFQSELGCWGGGLGSKRLHTQSSCSVPQTVFLIHCFSCEVFSGLIQSPLVTAGILRWSSGQFLRQGTSLTFLSHPVTSCDFRCFHTHQLRKLYPLRIHTFKADLFPTTIITTTTTITPTTTTQAASKQQTTFRTEQRISAKHYSVFIVFLIFW